MMLARYFMLYFFIESGKTYTAKLIAQAMMKLSSKEYQSMYSPSNSRITANTGVLLLHGEDYTDHEKVPEYHKQLKSRLVHTLNQCDGQGVVIFDDVHKVAPGTLKVYLEAMRSRHGRILDLNEANDETVIYSTNKVRHVLYSIITVIVNTLDLSLSLIVFFSCVYF